MRPASPRSALLALLAAPVLAAPLRAQEPEPPPQVEEPEELVRALREELSERWRELTGTALPPAELERALRETLLLRAVQARLVIERRAREARHGKLLEPRVVLQARGRPGAAPLAVDLLGAAAPEGTPRAERRLPQEPLAADEPARVWVRGGCLPAGKLLVLTRLTVRAQLGDAGRAALRCGEQELWASARAQAVEESLSGRWVVRPGEEGALRLELAAPGWLEVELEGTFEDQPGAPRLEEARHMDVPAAPRWDPSRGVSVRSTGGRVVVHQGEVVLWEGPGRSVSTQTELAGQGRKALVVTVDGEEVFRAEAPPAGGPR